MHACIYRNLSTYDVFKLDIGATVQQQPHNVRVAAAGCRHQRRGPALQVSGAPEHNSCVSTCAPRSSGRRGTYRVGLIWVHALVQQPPHLVHPASVGRVEQRRRPPPIQHEWHERQEPHDCISTCIAHDRDQTARIASVRCSCRENN